MQHQPDHLDLSEQHAERAYELSQRTNQLNFSGTKYSRDDIAAFLCPGCRESVFLLRCATAIAARGWLIFIGHDVAKEHSPWGRAPETLEVAVAKLQAAKIEILPIKNALGRVALSQ